MAICGTFYFIKLERIKGVQTFTQAPSKCINECQVAVWRNGNDVERMNEVIFVQPV